MTRTSTSRHAAAVLNTCSAFFVPNEDRDSRAIGLLQSNKIGTPSKHAEGLLFECISATAAPQNSNPTKYRINIGYNGVASCDCPDFHKKSGACKHLRAALLRLDDMRTAGIPIPDIPIPTSELEARFFKITLIAPAELFAWAKYAARHEVSGCAEDSENMEQVNVANTALEEQAITNAFRDLERDTETVRTPPCTTAEQWDQMLPEHLARLAVREVAPEALAAREQIRVVGPRLFSVASDTLIDPLGPLYRELDAVVNNISAEAPTHVLTVYSSPGQQHYHLMPVHAIVFSANCMTFQDFPPSPLAPIVLGGTVTLPVVPCCVPSLATFPILLEYLYTLRDESLIVSLLPLPLASAKILTDDVLTRHLAETYALPTLMQYVLRTYGLWLNVTALGVYDGNLWRAMDIAWNVLRGALAMTAEAGRSAADVHL